MPTNCKAVWLRGFSRSVSPPVVSALQDGAALKYSVMELLLFLFAFGVVLLKSRGQGAALYFCQDGES